MKKIIHLVTVLLLMAFSCKKENQLVTVVKDCTGTYLHYDGKDYHVCNPEKLSTYPNGSKVNASFKKIDECNGSAKDAIVCMMVHENEGWIEVDKIN